MFRNKYQKLSSLWFSNILSIRDNIVQEVIKANRENKRLPIKKLKNSGQLLDKYTIKLTKYRGGRLSGQ